MNKIVVYVFCWVNFSGCSNVCFFEEEKLHFLSQECPYSYIKFATLNQKRPFDVLLNNKGTIIQFELLSACPKWVLLRSRTKDILTRTTWLLLLILKLPFKTNGILQTFNRYNHWRCSLFILFFFLLLLFPFGPLLSLFDIWLIKLLPLQLLKKG